jgi:hypothetical protein
LVTPAKAGVQKSLENTGFQPASACFMLAQELLNYIPKNFFRDLFKPPNTKIFLHVLAGWPNTNSAQRRSQPLLGSVQYPFRYELTIQNKLQIAMAETRFLLLAFFGKIGHIS